MEVRKYDDIMGVVVINAITEGRMVFLADQSTSHNFGSRTDLPGVDVPATSAEAARASYIVAFASDNRSLPIYQPTPSYEFALREGFDLTANVPFATTVYLTHPGNMVGQTIPSGDPALAYAGGVFTVASGAFIYNANLVPGAFLVAADTSTDGAGEAGKLKYSASSGIGKVVQYDSTSNELTFRIFDN